MTERAYTFFPPWRPPKPPPIPSLLSTNNRRCARLRGITNWQSIKLHIWSDDACDLLLLALVRTPNTTHRSPHVTTGDAHRTSPRRRRDSDVPLRRWWLLWLSYEEQRNYNFHLPNSLIMDSDSSSGVFKGRGIPVGCLGRPHSSFMYSFGGNSNCNFCDYKHKTNSTHITHKT